MFIQEQKGITKRQISLLPVNNYAWSKLGGEASVQSISKFSNFTSVYD